MECYVQDTSSYLAAFLPSGCFATANETSNEVVLWPLPSEDKIIITEAAARLTIENTLQQIYRLVDIHPQQFRFKFSLFILFAVCGALAIVNSHFLLL